MRVLSRLSGYAVVLSILLPSPFAASNNTKDKLTEKASSATPLALLEEAERLSRGFVPDDRASLLLESAQSALPVNKAKAQTWALQLFAFSRASLAPGH